MQAPSDSRRTRQGLALGALLLAALYSTSVAAVPIPVALDPRNVADEGVISLYTGVVTSTLSGNDTEYTGDIANNMLNVSGALLGVQLDLATTSTLTELSAYVDPPGGGSDPFKNTTAVEFFVSTNGGSSFTSVGLVSSGSYAPASLGSFTYVSVSGVWQGVTNVRYAFTPQNGNGQRIAEVMAFVPEPSSLLLGLAGLGLVRLRRR